MTIERIQRDIPESEVAQVASDFESEGCMVIKVKQPDGKWMVKAVCPSGTDA